MYSIFVPLLTFTDSVPAIHHDLWIDRSLMEVISNLTTNIGFSIQIEHIKMTAVLNPSISQIIFDFLELVEHMLKCLDKHTLTDHSRE